MSILVKIILVVFLLSMSTIYCNNINNNSQNTNYNNNANSTSTNLFLDDSYPDNRVKQFLKNNSLFLFNEDSEQKKKLFQLGSNYGYFNSTEINIYLDFLVTKSQNILTKTKPYNITQNNNPIEFYKLSIPDKYIYNSNISIRNNINSNTNSNSNNTNSKKSILFTGAHHAREPVSYTMTLYILTNLMNQYFLGNHYVREIIHSVDIYFLPVVNKDGLETISKHHYSNPKSPLLMVRKNNREFNDLFVNCYNYNNKKELYTGVDLNRNYDSHFGENNIGSTNDVCDESYRGPSAFSEPETQAIKSFVDDIQGKTNNGLKIAYNYHAWGNMVIIPPNFMKVDPLEYIKKNFYNEFVIYEKILENGNFPYGYILGNGYKTVQYTANGEASDWFLTKRNIVSFSPELGTNNKKSDMFMPTIEETVTDILPKNLFPAIYSIQLLSHNLKLFKLSNTDDRSINSNTASYYKCLESDNSTNLNKLLKAFNNDLIDNMCTKGNYLYFIQLEIDNDGYSDYNPVIDNQTSKAKNIFGFNIEIDLTEIENLSYSKVAIIDNDVLNQFDKSFESSRNNNSSGSGININKNSTFIDVYEGFNLNYNTKKIFLNNFLIPSFSKNTLGVILITDKEIINKSSSSRNINNNKDSSINNNIKENSNDDTTLESSNDSSISKSEYNSFNINIKLNFNYIKNLNVKEKDNDNKTNTHIYEPFYFPNEMISTMKDSSIMISKEEFIEYKAKKFINIYNYSPDAVIRLIIVSFVLFSVILIFIYILYKVKNRDNHSDIEMSNTINSNNNVIEIQDNIDDRELNSPNSKSTINNNTIYYEKNTDKNKNYDNL